MQIDEGHAIWAAVDLLHQVLRYIAEVTFV